MWLNWLIESFLVLNRWSFSIGEHQKTTFGFMQILKKGILLNGLVRKYLINNAII